MKTKLFKMNGIYRPVFYRKVKLTKQTFWEYCETIYPVGRLRGKEYLWKRCEDPFVRRYGVVEGKNLKPSNRLEFLLLKGCSPESIRRIKRKKVER